jgi:hypothetical protein
MDHCWALYLVVVDSVQYLVNYTCTDHHPRLMLFDWSLLFIFWIYLVSYLLHMQHYHRIIIITSMGFHRLIITMLSMAYYLTLHLIPNCPLHLIQLPLYHIPSFILLSKYSTPFFYFYFQLSCSIATAAAMTTNNVV